MRRVVFAAVLLLIASAAFAATARPASADSPALGPEANTITLRTSPVDLTVQVNGSSVAAPYAFTCDPGTNRTITAPSPQVVSFVQYRFSNWSDGGSQSHVISCDTPGNFTAVFFMDYGFYMDSIPSGLLVEVDGAVYATPQVVWCSPGSMHTVFATSPQQSPSNATRYVFRSWGDGGAQNHGVVCNFSKGVVASFAASFVFTIFSSPSSGFAVTVDSATGPTPYSFECVTGASHVVSVPTPQVVAGEQWRFTRWLDTEANFRNISCDSLRNYTAIFERVPGTGPPGPFPGSPLTFAALLALLVFSVIVIPVLLLVRRDRRRTPAAAPPPIPAWTVRRPVATRRCPRCGNPAMMDWTYCMVCGEPVH